METIKKIILSLKTIEKLQFKSKWKHLKKSKKF